MARVNGFVFNAETGDLTMYAGDTGSFAVHCSRHSGEDWPSTARMLFTVKDPAGTIVMQRIYRLDDQWGAGDGYFLMEFHNGDTDQWPTGTYNTEWRFDINATWDGTAPTGRCVNGLTAGVKMTDGGVVRTKIQSTMSISGVLGDI